MANIIDSITSSAVKIGIIALGGYAAVKILPGLLQKFVIDPTQEWITDWDFPWTTTDRPTKDDWDPTLEQIKYAETHATEEGYHDPSMDPYYSTFLQNYLASLGWDPTKADLPPEAPAIVEYDIYDPSLGLDPIVPKTSPITEPTLGPTPPTVYQRAYNLLPFWAQQRFRDERMDALYLGKPELARTELDISTGGICPPGGCIDEGVTYGHMTDEERLQYFGTTEDQTIGYPITTLDEARIRALSELGG